MDRKQSTLRSQTKRCPNCGEYYSVTYKYCPFCEYGKPEERKPGAKGKGGLLGGLLGGEPQKSGSRPKKRPPEGKKRRPEGAKREEPPKKRPATEGRNHTPVEKSAAMSSYAAWYASPEYEATRKRSGGARKKTSEMTEEERAAYQAEREARAAQRKRERDRLSRAAGERPALVPDEDLPTETVVLPETSPQETVPVVEEPKPVQTEPDPITLENIPLYIPEGMPETAPEVAVTVETEVGAEAVAVEENPTAPVAQPVAPAEPVQPDGTPEGDLDALLREIRGMLYGVEETPAEEPAPQPLVQEAPLTAGELLAGPEEITIDQIMQEVRNGLLDMPAGAASVQSAPQPTEGSVPAEPIPEVHVQPEAETTQTVEEAPSSAAEVAQAAEEAPQSAAEVAQAVEEAPQSAAEHETQPPVSEEAEFPTENPFENLSQETRESDPAPEKAEPAEPEIIAVSIGKKMPETEAEPTPEPPKPEKKKVARKRGKKSKMPVLLLLSLVVIAAAVFIIFHSVVPTFRDGILSSGEETQTEVAEDTASTFTLDQTELNFVAPDTKVTLVPIFEPEGSTAALTWTCSDWSVAYLDADGTVTSLAPGDAVITATMANGQSAECQVHCVWDATAPAEQTEGTDSSGPALSSNDISLGEAGASKTLEVTGTSEKPVWASDDKAVATVDQNGVVTAVAKGSANITAKVGDKTLTCVVRCVW